MTRLRRLLDEGLFGPESAARLVTTQTLLVVAIGLRIALTPFTRFTDVPDALVFPVPFLAWLDGMPPAAVIVGIQVVGVAAAILAAARRWPRHTYALAWSCLLVLAGLKASRGKVLHNDLLLLWTAAVFLLAPIPANPRDRTPSRLYGWPVRTAIAVMALIYWFAAYHKLRRSGPGWVFGENMAHLLRWAPLAGEPRLPDLSRWVGDRVLLAQLGAASILLLELTFPLVVWWRRMRPMVALTAVVLHVMTWVLLGLDYWMWAVTVPIVLLDWSPLLARFLPSRAAGRSPRGQVSLS